MSLEGQKTTTSYMEWNDFTSLIAKLEKDEEYKFCLLVAIGVFTGLRISDLLNLKYTDVFSGELLTIQEKKTKKIRKIKLNPDLKEIIDRVVGKMEVRDLNQHIFINKYGTKPIDKSYVNVKLKQLFRKYRVRVGGNISTHTFRKTLGRRVVELNNYSDKSMVLLMDLFGHSSQAITKRYLGIREQEILDVYDSLSL